MPLVQSSSPALALYPPEELSSRPVRVRPPSHQADVFKPLYIAGADPGRVTGRRPPRQETVHKGECRRPFPREDRGASFVCRLVEGRDAPRSWVGACASMPPGSDTSGRAAM